MTYKVIRKNGGLVCFGPDEPYYQPFMREGEVMAVEVGLPIFPPPTDAEKTTIASEALKLVAACLLEAVFDMKANPANYPTAASLKQKALELYKARL